jgi:hypothetical protein
MADGMPSALDLAICRALGFVIAEPGQLRHERLLIYRYLATIYAAP